MNRSVKNKTKTHKLYQTIIRIQILVDIQKDRRLIIEPFYFSVSPNYKILKNRALLLTRRVLRAAFLVKRIRHTILYTVYDQLWFGTRYGIRIRVAGMKILSPRPLDEPSIFFIGR